jgi:hypothetical protein
MCPQLKERAILSLKQEMLKRESVSYTCTSTATHSPIIQSSTSSISCSSSSSTNSLSSRKLLLMEIYDKQPAVPEKTSAEQELEKYLLSTSLVEDEEEDDILSYWKEYEKLFPMIASIARDILAIPASNTSVERLFSSCKNTITDKRTKLGADKLNKLMFLQKNMNILKEKFGPTPIITNIGQDTKRTHDTITLDNQSMSKKFKPHDSLIDYHNENDYLVSVSSEDDE